MKKITIAIMSFCFPCMCLADDHAKGEGKGSPSIWVVRHIEVELDNAKDFEAAVAKKTKNTIVKRVLIYGPHGKF